MQQYFYDYELSPEITRALDQLNYTKPTDIQLKVIPPLLEQTDLIVQAQTGSGKTAAFAIPLCEKVEWVENKPQALVLTPTRELAQQVAEDFTHIGRYKRIKATTLYGKQSFERQKQALKQKSHIVVGTPGRVLDHLKKGTFAINKLNYLIIDEADEMLNMGFIEQVESIIDQLPQDRVTCLFSATLPIEIKTLANQYMKRPTEIKLSEGVVAKKVNHQLMKTDQSSKYKQLQDTLIAENPDRCIIFCRTQARVDELTDKLNNDHIPCDKIHGGMIQEDRFEVMSDFKKGHFRYLAATDVAARGIDVEHVPLVVNYDIPLEKEKYVHRIGRTARAGRSGKAITFVTPSEVNYLEEIEAYLGEPIEIINPPNRSDVEANQTLFKQKINAQPTLNKAKNEQLDAGITKLYFNGGKKKKIRAADFVGTISNIPGVKADDIGIITIENTHSYVEILNDKGKKVLDEMKTTTIKGKLLKVHLARN